MKARRLPPGTVIFRYEIPVDDQWHTFLLAESPLAFGCRHETVVEFWAQPARLGGVSRTFKVVGTGQPIDEGTWYHATVVSPSGRFVWHVVGRAGAPSEEA